MKFKTELGVVNSTENRFSDGTSSRAKDEMQLSFNHTARIGMADTIAP
jgi:hypothetical protein